MMNCSRVFLVGKIIPLNRITIGAFVLGPWNTKLFCTSPFLDLYLQRHVSYLTCRTKASYTAVETTKIGTWRKSLKKWFNFSKSKQKRAGYYLYEEIADGVDYSSFFKTFKFEDTFFSWYLITELHVWMLLVRVMAEEDGKVIRNSIIVALWEDVTNRSKLLGAVNPSALRQQRVDLYEQFQAAIVNYDEGILSDDKVLAGAVWRRFLNSQCDDAEKVESLVMYIRKQSQLLEEITVDQLLENPKVKWIPLESIKRSIACEK